MKSFQAFVLYDYLILFGLILVAVIGCLIIIHKSKQNLEKNNKLISRKNQIIKIYIGLILTILSIIGYIFIEKSHSGLFEVLSIMTCRPFVLLSIAGLLAGLIFLISSIYRIKINKKSK